MNKDFDPKDIVMNFPRRDARDKLMGRTKFSIDSFGSDVLHAVLLRSDVPSAEIIGIDFEAAKSMPGVKGIATFQDAPNFMAWELLIHQYLQIRLCGTMENPLLQLRQLQ